MQREGKYDSTQQRDERERKEAERIVQNIQDMQLYKKPIDLTELEAFANKLGGNHPTTTWMLDQVEAMGIDVIERILLKYENEKIKRSFGH